MLGSEPLHGRSGEVDNLACDGEAPARERCLNGDKVVLRTFEAAGEEPARRRIGGSPAV